MKPYRMLIDRLSKDRSGNIAVISALCAPLILYVLSLGVDYGLLTLQQRKLQDTADLASIIAASDATNAETNVLTYFQQNNLDMAIRTPTGYVSNKGKFPLGDQTTEAKFDGIATLTSGTYAANASVAPADRFVAGAKPTDAVKVAVQQTGGLFFASSISAPPKLTAVGTAATQKIAAFSIGSRLASLNNGVLNALLNSLLGTSLSLSVMDYQALASADVNALSVIDSLATNLNLTAGSYSDTLSTDISYGDFIKAVGKQTGLSPTVKTAIKTIEAATNSTRVKFDLGDILALGPASQRVVGSGSHLNLEANVMDLISASALAANGSKQVAVNLNGTVPGLSTVQLTLAIGEPAQQTPSLAVGSPGTVIRTVQTRLKLSLTVDGLSALLGLKLKIPLYIEVASGQGTLASIACLGNGAQNANVTIDTIPGVADVYLGDVDTSKFSNFGSKPSVSPAALIDSLLVKVTASSHVAITNMTKTSLTFSPSDISNGNYRTASTHDTLTSTVASLLGNIAYKIKILIVTIGTQSSIQQALSAVMTSITAPLDTLLDNILMTLGVRIGEADVRVTDVRCQQPVLVQ
ncbi:hypothetical protein DTW90_19670 [Neorhizobium sp. P12A]|nr:hypothetical protein DTW90_19670 [Neorhizobium sp. P12A]